MLSALLLIGDELLPHPIRLCL